jgi:Rap1a immunity proteins
MIFGNDTKVPSRLRIARIAFGSCADSPHRTNPSGRDFWERHGSICDLPSFWRSSGVTDLQHRGLAIFGLCCGCHSRAAMVAYEAYARNLGLTLESEKIDGERVYRIAAEEVFPMQLAALVVAAGLFGSTSAFAALDSGKTLWDSCNDLNDTSKQSYCLGYVAGVSDVLVGMHIICIGEHISVRQIADVVVQYLREHPGRRDMDADDLTATALALAFPCK